MAASSDEFHTRFPSSRTSFHVAFLSLPRREIEWTNGVSRCTQHKIVAKTRIMSHHLPFYIRSFPTVVKPIRSVEEFHFTGATTSLYLVDKLPSSRVRQETLSVDEPEVSLRENYIVRVFQLNELYHVSGRVDFCASFHTVSRQKEVIHGRIGTPRCPRGRSAFVSNEGGPWP